MSIYYSGTFKRSGGLISAINKQLKLVNLKPVKKIQVQFDPFHPNALTAREFLYHITQAKVTKTNLNCIIKPVVVCDRSDPEIKVDLLDKRSISFLANNLSVLDILQAINKHVSSTVKPDIVVTQVTKSEKKNQKKR